MSNPLTFPVFFLSFLFFVAGLFLFLVFFLLHLFLQHVAFLFSFFLFASVGSSVCCSFVLVFFVFLLLSIPAFFFVLFVDVVLWCLKTVVYGNQVRFESLKNSAGTSTKSDKCYIVIYTFMHHNDTTSKTDAWRKTPEGRHRKISLITFYLSFYCKGLQGLFKGLHVRGCWRLNINSIFWPHCYDRHVVSFLFS